MITDKQWLTVTKQLDQAIKYLASLIKLYGECKFTDTGFCYHHGEEPCPVNQAQMFLEEIQ